MSCPLPACYNITREFRAPIYLPEGMTLGGMGVGPRKGVKGGLGERIGREGPQVLDLQ